MLNKEDAAFGSLFSIGWAFAFGIAFAIITCAPVSGGHFNPVRQCVDTIEGSQFWEIRQARHTKPTLTGSHIRL